MEKKEFSLYSRIIVVVVVIIGGFFLVREKKEKALDLDKRGRYTIGETKGWVRNHRSSDYELDYSYSFNGTVYKSFMMLHNLSGIKVNGAKYIVTFDPEHPKNSKMLFNMEVLHHLGNFADTGWITIPDFVVLNKNNTLGK